MHSAIIRAIASELPAVVSDAALAAECGIAEAEVARWAAGRVRRESPDGEGPAALAAKAGARVLAACGLEPADVDFVIFATNTPDMFFPGSACLLQAGLALRTVGGLDIRSQCTGFLAALDVASRFVATGMYARVLVAAADTPSHFNARDGRSPLLTCAMGDAGAAALVEGGDGNGRILSSVVRTDGSRHRDWWCEFPASRHRVGDGFAGRDRLPADKVAEGRHFPEVDVDRLRELALERVPGVFREALVEAGLERVDATLVAHLDRRVEAELPALLGEAAGRIEAPGLLYSGGASLAVLLATLREEGRLAPGQAVALVTAGSGASWGAAVVRVP